MNRDDPITFEGVTQSIADWALDYGITADTIVRAAHEHDVDLVVVGHSTDEGLTGLLRREVAPQLVTAAGRPVLVIPVSVDVESTAGAVA